MEYSKTIVILFEVHFIYMSDMQSAWCSIYATFARISKAADRPDISGATRIVVILTRVFSFASFGLSSSLGFNQPHNFFLSDIYGITYSVPYAMR